MVIYYGLVVISHGLMADYDRIPTKNERYESLGFSISSGWITVGFACRCAPDRSEAATFGKASKVN